MKWRFYSALPAIRMQDYGAARKHLEEAKAAGLEQAGATPEQLDRGRR